METHSYAYWLGFSLPIILFVTGIFGLPLALTSLRRFIEFLSKIPQGQVAQYHRNEEVYKSNQTVYKGQIDYLQGQVAQYRKNEEIYKRNETNLKAQIDHLQGQLAQYRTNEETHKNNGQINEATLKAQIDDLQGQIAQYRKNEEIYKRDVAALEVRNNTLRTELLMSKRRKKEKILEAIIINWPDFVWYSPETSFCGSQLYEDQLNQAVELALSRLTEREQAVIRHRFGINEEPKTLEGAAKALGIETRERVRQLEAKALRKLHHPTYSRKLRDFLGEKHEWA